MDEKLPCQHMKAIKPTDFLNQKHNISINYATVYIRVVEFSGSGPRNPQQILHDIIIWI
jgi:hypothetical protein